MSEAESEREAAPAMLESWMLRVRRHAWLRRFLLRQVSLRRRCSPYLLGLRMSQPETGLLGEHLAVKHLREEGRRVLFRNYLGLHRGEVDIVARHGEVLTFVEVKTRRSEAFGRPADAVTQEKQQLIQRGALDWLRLLGNPRVAIRFDIAEVVLIDGELPRVHVMENAFTVADSSMAGR